MAVVSNQNQELLALITDADINKPHGNYANLFLYALGAGKHSFAKVILNRIPSLLNTVSDSADPDSAFKQFCMAIVDENDLVVLQMLSDHSIQQPHSAYANLFIYAIRHNKIAAAFAILARLPELVNSRNINSEGVFGNSALHYCIENPRLFKKLVEQYGADYNLPGLEGNTALHLAARYNNLQTLQYLSTRAELDKNARNNTGDTALHIAVNNREYAATALLISMGVDMCLYANNGFAPIHIAVSSDKVEMLPLFSKHLNQRGLQTLRIMNPNDPNLVQREPQTALELSIGENAEGKCTRFLLQNSFLTFRADLFANLPALRRLQLGLDHKKILALIHSVEKSEEFKSLSLPTEIYKRAAKFLYE